MSPTTLNNWGNDDCGDAGRRTPMRLILKAYLSSDAARRGA
jgi:hypothetical protein